MFSSKFLQKTQGPLALGVFGAAIALTASLIRGIETLNFPDAVHFLEQASAIHKGWNFMEANPFQLQFPFGLPFLIAFTYLLTSGTSLFMIKLFLAVAHGLSTYLVAKIGIKIGLRTWWWIVAALLFCLDPFVLSAATALQSESITTLFVLWWAYLYISLPTSKHEFFIASVLFPISGFLAILVRPNILIPFIGVAFLMFWKSPREDNVKRKMFSSVGVLLLLLGSFELFLVKLYRGLVFLAPNGGINSVLTCRSEFLSQYFGFASVSENSRINRWYFKYLDTLTTNILSKQSHTSIPKLNNELYSVGINNCLDHAGQSSFLLIAKTFALWRPSTVLGAYGVKMFALSLLIWIPLTALTMWFIAHKQIPEIPSRLKWYFMVLAIGFSISLLPSATQIRHRVAFAEPFYWLFTAYFFNLKLKRKSKSK